jgi:hypothetical protein
MTHKNLTENDLLNLFNNRAIVLPFLNPNTFSNWKKTLIDAGDLKKKKNNLYDLT